MPPISLTAGGNMPRISLPAGGNIPRISLPALIALLALIALPASAPAQDSARTAEQAAPVKFTAQQLDNLVSPIALYPDALLAQVLVASTFPEQVEDAAKFVRQQGTGAVDSMSWDVSVKSVAHYPTALNAMAEKADWTTTLGQAYAFQSSDVMAAVQRMRAMAAAQGNLVSTEQHEVLQEAERYVIVPAQPEVIYVPVYDPYMVYSQPVFGSYYNRSFWSFGIGFPIGAWLNYDCDWGRSVVYYNGWNHDYLAFGGGWRQRSLPFIRITNVYVSPIYQTVYVGRSPWHRRPDYARVDEMSRIHRNVFLNDGRGRAMTGNRDGWIRATDRTTRTAQPRTGATATRDGYTKGGSNGVTGATDAMSARGRDANVGANTVTRNGNNKGSRRAVNRDSKDGRGAAGQGMSDRSKAIKPTTTPARSPRAVERPGATDRSVRSGGAARTDKSPPVTTAKRRPPG